MPLIQTADLPPESGPTDAAKAQTNHQIYCGLDSCVTLEVREELEKTYGQPPAIYDFERALQAPYLEIMERGWLIDDPSRRHAVAALNDRIFELQSKLNLYTDAWWDRGLNPRSHDQLAAFFYGAMKLPEIWISQKGEKKRSLNREVLEQLEEHYLHARPIVACILAIRDLEKQREVFETEIDPDGRFRTTYNIAGTETGRPSSSKSAHGTGGNVQNIDPRLRYAFTSDLGYKLGQIDLEQVEGRDVGWFCGVLFGDWTYLDSCESGDLHTYNSRLTWPGLAWTGDLRKDKSLADTLIVYRDFSYRHLMKRGSYLTNYMGTPYTASRVLKVPLEVMEEFQARYCVGRASDPRKPFNPALPGWQGNAEIVPAFPAIPRFWQWVAQEIQTKHLLVTPFGRRRHFFGRPDDSATIREGIAFLPQSTTADRMNLGLWKVWKRKRNVELLGNGFDSITFQYRETEDEQELIAELLSIIEECELRDPRSGRRYFVPGEAKVGWNWGECVTPGDVEKAKAQGRSGHHLPRLNPLGLRKWEKGKRDVRERPTGLRRIML